MAQSQKEPRVPVESVRIPVGKDRTICPGLRVSVSGARQGVAVMSCSSRKGVSVQLLGAAPQILDPRNFRVGHSQRISIITSLGGGNRFCQNFVVAVLDGREAILTPPEMVGN